MLGYAQKKSRVVKLMSFVEVFSARGITGGLFFVLFLNFLVTVNIYLLVWEYNT